MADRIVRRELMTGADAQRFRHLNAIAHGKCELPRAAKETPMTRTICRTIVFLLLIAAPFAGEATCVILMGESAAMSTAHSARAQHVR